MTAHHCPVCRRRVDETPAGQIAGHYDTNHEQCPASFEPFWIATVVDYTPAQHEYPQLFDDQETLRQRLGALERAVKKLQKKN